MALKDIITSPWTWGLTIGAAALIGVGVIASGKKNTPALEQRQPEREGFSLTFGSPDKKIPGLKETHYEDGKETYGLGLSLIEALERENGKKMTDSDKFYFITTYLDTDDKDGVSPKELSDYINGKKADGSERKWAKGLKPVKTEEDVFHYKFQVDYNPAELSRLHKIIEKHAAIRHARYETQDEKDMWRYHAMKWAAQNFGKDNYLNADAVSKYEAHVNKLEGALK